MIRTEAIIESRPTALDLSDEEATLLAALGRRLASRRTWWGDDEVQDIDRSVIGCHRLPGGRWTVTVREAIGAIRVGKLQIVIRPKIPPNHFCYLASRSDLLPRIEDLETSLVQGSDFIELVVRWFLKSLERLLRKDLARGYTDRTEELAVVRGRVVPIETTLLLLQGKARALCDFEDFTEDIPINRVLRAAAGRVAASPLLAMSLRSRARAVLCRLGETGPLRATDVHARVERLTQRYTCALAFAKQLLGMGGMQLEHGDSHAWSFLIRTPELIETGIREALNQALSPTWPVIKRARKDGRSSVTFNPDLVFGSDAAIGDVKYKIASADWVRGDLLQSIAFATAFRSNRALLVGFSEDGRDIPSQVEAGEVLVRFFPWQTCMTPVEAHGQLSSAVKEWLELRSEPGFNLSGRVQQRIVDEQLPIARAD